MPMLSTVETTLGQRIQAEIKRNRMSMRALAREMDDAQPTVFKWCHDITEPRHAFNTFGGWRKYSRFRRCG